MFYIRFTKDIYTDIENGSSYNNQGTVKMPGLCAFSIRGGNLHENSLENEILEEAKLTAINVAKGLEYASLNDGNYSVLRGRYVGSGNDGVFIINAEVIGNQCL